MSPADPKGKPPRGRRRCLRLLAAIALVAFLAPLPAVAEIYRWTDDDGTAHFTDDPAQIPERHRAKASILIRRGPSVIESAPAVPAETPPGAPAEGGEIPEGEELIQEAEQLRAKIAAKEELVRAVDGKLSLAVNPLRNRVVDPADMDLYNKYQAELPGDRERLDALQSRIDALR